MAAAYTSTEIPFIPPSPCHNRQPVARERGHILTRAMTLRTRILAGVLALLMAVWSPVCLCSGGSRGAGHDAACDSEACPGHHADHDIPDPGAPRDDHKGTGCECPQIPVTPGKS